MAVARTVERHVEPDGALDDPLADAVAGAPLDAGHQRCVIDDAVKHLALRYFGGHAHGSVWRGSGRAWRDGAATHGAGRAGRGWGVSGGARICVGVCW